MSGPRVTSGTNSKQDYQTPKDFITAVEKRFGPIMFDLAAHAGNNIHPRYFAPYEFIETLKLGDKDVDTSSIMSLGESLVSRGSSRVDASAFVQRALSDNTLAHHGKPRKVEYRITNSDAYAEGFNALQHDWSKLSPGGILWLNCEFAECADWVLACADQSQVTGVHILLLTPASVGSNWARDYVFPYADVTMLNGRLMFDGENMFPKDCMLSHFHPWESKSRTIDVWDWRKGKITSEWSCYGKA